MTAFPRPAARSPRSVALLAALAALAAALVAVAVAVPARPAAAQPGFAFARLSGTDRYDTAGRIAVQAFGTAGTALIASGENGHFADALAGTFLAGGRSAPILLTAAHALPAGTRAALRQLQTRAVVLLGGTSAVGPEVEAALRAAGLAVTRIGGVDRYDTARRIAAARGGSLGSAEGRGPTAIVADGRTFPDALVAGPLSYARALPVVPTDPGSLPAASRQSLAALHVRYVLVAGGPAAVSAHVVAQLTGMGLAVRRLSGPSRSDTARALADYALSSLRFTPSHVDLATGTQFPDALAGGPAAGRSARPILLTDSGTSLGPAAAGYLAEHAATLVDGRIFGGTSAVSGATAGAAVTAATARRVGSSSYALTPTTDLQQPAGAARGYAVRGLSPTGRYSLALLDCAVVTGSGASSTFRGTPVGGRTVVAQGTGGAAAANVLVVGGRPVGAAYALPAGASSLDFLVRNTGAGSCVAPLLYEDLDANRGLDLGPGGTPTEPYRLGGELASLASVRPAYAGDFPDPAVLPVVQGGVTRYYAFSTQVPNPRSPDGWTHLPVTASTSPTSFPAPTADALPRLPSWAKSGNVWAPSVLARPGGYVLYYAVTQASSGRQCLSVATASSPAGPYTDRSAAPLVCPLDRAGAIDPTPFVDRDGTAYLIFKTEDNALGRPTTLWSRRLTPDGRAFAGPSNPLLTATRPWQGGIIEGPAMVYAGGRYLLFYGANAWESANAGIGYAVCASPVSRCVEGSVDGPWLGSRPGARGPASPHPYLDPASGVVRLAYHAWGDVVGYAQGGRRALWTGVLTVVGGRPVLQQ